MLFYFVLKGCDNVDVFMDALGALGSQAFSGIAKIVLAGLGVIATLVAALVVQTRKNKKE